jgi:hypothetical protein
MESIGQDADKKKGHAAKMPHRRYAYFRDNQIMFLVTHASGTLSKNLLVNFRGRIDAQLVTGKTVENPPQMISFPEIDPEQGNQRLGKLREMERLERDGNNPLAGYRPPLSLRLFSF